MDNTSKSFFDKWDNNSDLIFKETIKEGSETFRWILERNGFKNSKSFSKFLNSKKRILDAGCGNGRVTALLRKYSNSKFTHIVGIDLVESAIKSSKDNLIKYENIEIIQKNLLNDLKDLGKFDIIYCQEILHHTENPEKAFGNLCDILDDKGEIAIYVYKKKAPVREFVDDFIRDKISSMSYVDAIEVCKQITKLGKVLSEQNIKIKIPKVDVLEIESGEYDLQRFIYHFFMKCFWNAEFTLNSNTIINYDWYHPQLCFRFELNDLKNLYKKNNLKINHIFIDYYGITIKGKK